MKSFFTTALLTFTLTGLTQTLIPYLSSDKYGYADENGKMIIEPQYDNAKIMVSNAGAVFNGDKWGAINAEGKKVLPFEFDEIEITKNGDFAYLRITQNGKNGLASLEGKIIVPANFTVTHFFNDAFLGCNNGICTIYSAQGKEINQVEAVAVVYDNNLLYAMDSKEVVFYNVKGKAYAEIKDFETIEVLSENFIQVKSENGITLISNQSILLDEENSFLEVKAYELLAKAKKESGWGLANHLGWILEPKYEDVKIINEQLLGAKSGGFWALFDLNGNRKTDFLFKRFDKIKGTDKFLKAYTPKDLDLYYANGEPTNITSVYALTTKALNQDGIPFKQKMWGVTSLDKGVIIEPLYKKIYTTNSGNFIVVKGDRYGVLSSTGKEIVEPNYDRIIEKDNIFLASKDYNYSILGGNGETLLKQKEPWGSQEFIPKGLYRVTREKLQGVINGKGEIIVPIEYTKIDTLNHVLITTKGKEKYAYTYTGNLLFTEPYFGFNQKNNWLEVKKNANGFYLYGWYNLKKEEWLLEPKWRSINEFNTGLNFIGETEENLFEILDANKKIIIPPAEDLLLPLTKYSNLFLAQTSGGYWLKNLDGSNVYPYTFELINIWHGAKKGEYTFYVIQDKKYGLMNDKGEMILNADLDELEDKKRDGESFFRIKKGDKWGMINQAGKIIFEPNFYSINEIKEGWFLLEENRGDKKYIKNIDGVIFKN